MIKIKTLNVFGFEGAIEGMRNPYESWDKSDSVDCRGCEYFDVDRYACSYSVPCPYGRYLIGKADMELAKKLIKAGSEHREFLCMIHVQADVIAPRYWWAEMDKYEYVKVNSSSTMHLITKRELTIDDFGDVNNEVREMLSDNIIPTLNKWIDEYNDILDNDITDIILMSIKQLLPESFMQWATYDMSYETLLNIYQQRKNHRLSEWKEFIDWCLTLPYFSEFIGDSKNE